MVEGDENRERSVLSSSFLARSIIFGTCASSGCLSAAGLQQQIDLALAQQLLGLDLEHRPGLAQRIDLPADHRQPAVARALIAGDDLEAGATTLFEHGQLSARPAPEVETISS